MYTYLDGPVIKGSRDGLVIVIDGRMNPDVVKTELQKRFSSAEDFFTDAQAAVRIMHDRWSDDQVEQIQKLLQRWSISVSEIQMECEDELDQPEDRQTNGSSEYRLSLAQDIEELLSAEIKDPSLPEPDHLSHEPEVSMEKSTSLIRRTLRSGQHIRYDGHVVVIGDVNPGAEITASGDIIVFGAFRGVAHAGATGDEGAVVAALKLQPTQLRIANYISRPPDGRAKTPEKPEIARIKSGQIEIDRFLG